MANTTSAYNTLSGMVVNTQAAAIYAAFERSLFLSGQLIEGISVPAGSYTAQVPLVDGTVTVDEAAHGGDFANEELTLSQIDATKNEVRAITYGARALLRNIGSPDPTAVGATIGNKISAAYDSDVMTALYAMTANTAVATAGDLTMDKLFEAASVIRARGETGPLVGIVTPAMAYQLMKNVANTNFAGGDYQGEALRNGFVTSAAGIQIFQSSHATTDGVVFGADCARQAMFSPLAVTITDAPTKLGMDVVGSLAQGVKVIDEKRGVVITAA
jgi:hypothetical protein